MKAKKAGKIEGELMTANALSEAKFVGAVVSTSYLKVRPDEDPFLRADTIIMSDCVYVRKCNDPRYIKGQAHRKFLVGSKCTVLQNELKASRFRFFDYAQFIKFMSHFPAMKLFIENSDIQNAFELADRFEGATISVCFDFEKYFSKVEMEGNSLYPKPCGIIDRISRQSNKDAWKLKKE